VINRLKAVYHEKEFFMIKKQVFWGVLACLLVSGLAFVSCGDDKNDKGNEKGNGITGDWVSSFEYEGVIFPEHKFVFAADGKWASYDFAKEGYNDQTNEWGGEGSWDADDTGTYTVEPSVDDTADQYLILTSDTDGTNKIPDGTVRLSVLDNKFTLKWKNEQDKPYVKR
jgi:hypothetical protein